MSSVFEGYERQYCELSANLSRKCTSASGLDGEIRMQSCTNLDVLAEEVIKTKMLNLLKGAAQEEELKKQKLSEINTALDEADTLLRKMDLEARSLPPNVKAMFLTKLREYKTDLNNLKNESRRVTSANGNHPTRDELLESGKQDAITVAGNQRGRLMMSTERLNQSSDRIRESRKTMLETEELGVSILQDLHQQRQALLHAHNTIQGVDDNIEKSKRVLTAMARRMNRNKCLIVSIIAALVFAILVVLYFKLTH